MSVHILYDQFKRKSVMYCSTDGQAFGPIFDDQDAAAFTDWMLANDRDPRDYDLVEIERWVETWEAETAPEPV